MWALGPLSTDTKDNDHLGFLKKQILLKYWSHKSLFTWEEGKDRNRVSVKLKPTWRTKRGVFQQKPMTYALWFMISVVSSCWDVFSPALPPSSLAPLCFLLGWNAPWVVMTTLSAGQRQVNCSGITTARCDQVPSWCCLWSQTGPVTKKTNQYEFHWVTQMTCLQ